MEYAIVFLLSLIATAAAIGENKAIRVENIQDVCAAVSGVSQHIERRLPGSECVYTVNGPNACKNCLDLNCSIAISYSFVRIALASELSVLPCHDGSLDVPSHAFASRILDENGKLLFRRLSSQSFDDSFEIEIPAFFLPFSVTVEVSAIIENRRDGIFIQVDATVYGSSFEVFPPTFIPITCSEVERPVCFGRNSDESSTSTLPLSASTPALASAGTPTSTSAGTPTSTSAGTPTSTSAGTPTSTSAGTPTSTSAGTPPSTSAETPTSTSVGTPPSTSAETPTSTSAGTTPSTSARAPTPTSAGIPTLISSSAGTLTSKSVGTPTPTPQDAGGLEPTLDNSGAPILAAAVWTILLLTSLSLASLCY